MRRIQLFIDSKAALVFLYCFKAGNKPVLSQPTGATIKRILDRATDITVYSVHDNRWFVCWKFSTQQNHEQWDTIFIWTSATLAGEPAWHMLGTVNEEGSSATEALKAFEIRDGISTLLRS